MGESIVSLNIYIILVTKHLLKPMKKTVQLNLNMTTLG